MTAFIYRVLLACMIAGGASEAEAPVWVVDRVVDDAWVVLELPSGDGVIDVPIDAMPAGVQEGDRLTFIIIDPEDLP